MNQKGININGSSLLMLFLFCIHIISSFEIMISFIVGFFLIFIAFNKLRLFKTDFNIISILILILLLGILSALFQKPKPLDFYKDFLYFLKPILLLILGYLLAKNINDWKKVFKVLILFGVFIALYHIFHFIIFLDINHLSVSRIRAINGLDNPIEIVSISILLLSYKFPKINVINNKTTQIIFLILLSVSFVLYLSRTMFVGIFLIGLGAFGYTKLNKKGFIYFVWFIIFTIGFYITLNHSNINRNASGFENFLYKIKIAPEEIFVPKLDLKNHANLWDHWRAYEAYCALEELNKDKKDYIFGKGFGSLVDLKFNAPLNEKGMRYIPILHNGYIYILFKTGLIGLILYLFFLMYLYFQSYFVLKDDFQRVFSNFLSGIALYFIFTSLIISGIYNSVDMIVSVLGMFMYLSNKNLYKTA